MQIKKAIKKGFTLVELVVVIAVIAILAATSVGVYFGMLESANRSADEQAVTQMNKVLQIENILDGVDSILDVHEALEENGLTAENYTALASNHTFYYDTGYNKILYVNTSTSEYKVEYPSEHEGDTYEKRTKVDGFEWYSLNLSLKEEKVNPTVTNKDVAYSINTGAEFAYALSTLNKNEVYNAGHTVTINLNKDIDLMGANIAVETASNVTIVGNGYTIKNITNNKAALLSDKNALNKEAKYLSGGLFSKVTGNLTVDGVNFKHINIDAPTTGSIGIIAGEANHDIYIKNVTVSNSQVIGNRSVGALIGYASSFTYKTKLENVTLDDVSVRTNGGRSALVIGYCNPNITESTGWLTVDDLSIEPNCSFGATEGSHVFDNFEESKYYEGDNRAFFYKEGQGSYIDNPEKSQAWGYRSDALISYYDSLYKEIPNVGKDPTKVQYINSVNDVNALNSIY